MDIFTFLCWSFNILFFFFFCCSGLAREGWMLAQLFQYYALKWPIPLQVSTRSIQGQSCCSSHSIKVIKAQVSTLENFQNAILFLWPVWHCMRRVPQLQKQLFFIFFFWRERVKWADALWMRMDGGGRARERRKTGVDGKKKVSFQRGGAAGDGWRRGRCRGGDNERGGTEGSGEEQRGGVAVLREEDGGREAQIERLERRRGDKGTESEIKKAGGRWGRREAWMGVPASPPFSSPSQSRANDAGEQLRRWHNSTDWTAGASSFFFFF